MTRSVDSLRAFMAGARPAPFDPRPGVVVVGAGKGGVGTSTVSALLALTAARRGENVLLVDADESVGSLHLMLGIDSPGAGLGALRGGHMTPQELLIVAGEGLTLLPGGGGGVDATLSSATAERRALFRRVADLYDRYDLVVVDGGSRLESVMAACRGGVERLLCVTEPGRISLAASYALFKVARTRFESLPVELVVNGAEQRQGRGLHSVVAHATQSFLGTDVSLGGVVPLDAVLHDGMDRGVALQRLLLDSEAAAAVGGLADRILLEHDHADEAGAGVVPLRARI